MVNKRKLSKISGLLYLIIVITGMFSLAYVPNQLFAWDSPSRTFENIRNNETLFRMSIASSVICYVTFIFLPLVLYQLLGSVNRFAAKIMAVLAIVSVPISLINLQNKYAILYLVEISRQQGAYSIGEIHAQTMLYLNQYDNGILISTVFWGLWLLPFGYLTYRSGFLPKLLGVFLVLGCLGYLINYFGNTLSDSYKTLGLSQYLGLLPAFGEIGTCLWLLFVGAKNKE
ncbi:DUF4386 domain-containing protein [Flavobacterium phragmitis]|uniref:DUF4386 domain-containing protein n=1 Tax=Flavobacterium phragmitis TaxID=739143 RepID=A0A1I1WSH5_9FLAO|nr:DUF4386 domain-containing protein [Flavobacterium phragmitis]SFD98076.1 protein of unknown function [Flavobacterium phragmitis]